MKFLYLLVISLALLSSCKSDVSEVPVPDVHDITVDYNLVRYEQELAALDTNNLVASFTALRHRHSAFTDLYFSSIVPINEDEYGEAFLSEINALLTDSRFRLLIDTVQTVFPDFDKTVLPDIEKAFKTYKYYFPDFKSPNVYTLVSEYAYQQFLFVDDDQEEGLGIGLDLFLGADFPYGRIAPGHPSFSAYFTRTFDRNHIVSKVMRTILEDRLPQVSKSTLLDHIIDNGKKLYLLKHILPETPDSIILEFTSEQTEWVQNNELAMWAFFFNENLFYETDMIKINKYINPSPNSPGMPDIAPGRTGNYIGWQIIKAYMSRHPETTMQDLLEMKDAQKIMELSKYKPKKQE